MATETSNYGLIKPAQDEFYDINVQNDNMDKIDEALGKKMDADYCILMTITLPEGRMRGDVDGDGYITQVDYELIRNDGMSGKLEGDAKTCADVDDNGGIIMADANRIQDYLRSPVKKPGGYFSDIRGNWTLNPNYASEEGQFYVDIAVEGLTAAHSAVLIVGKEMPYDRVKKAECMEGVLRVYAELAPITAVECILQTYEGDGTCTVVHTSVPNAAEIGAPVLKTFSGAIYADAWEWGTQTVTIEGLYSTDDAAATVSLDPRYITNERIATWNMIQSITIKYGYIEASLKSEYAALTAPIGVAIPIIIEVVR